MTATDYAAVVAAFIFSALGCLGGLLVGFLLFCRRVQDLETYENVDENHR